MRKLCSGSSASAARAALQRVEDLVVLGEEALEQLPGEIVLVLEMIEEAALGDAGRLDQLVDRGRGEALVNDRIISDVEEPGAGPLALGRRRRAGQVYRGCGFLDQLLDHRRSPLPMPAPKLPE